MHKVIQQDFSARFSYPVIFSRDVFDQDNPSIADLLRGTVSAHPDVQMLIYIDEGLSHRMPDIADRAAAYMKHHLPELTLPLRPSVITGGEAIKSDRDAVDQLLRDMADAQLDRHSYVMAIGGGAVLDAVGYAASLVHRGVRMIRLPTTVLAQNDAGVGVKTAINDPAGKNFFGTFAPPWAVINDASFLELLPASEWRSGIAEAFKVALIKDAAFFDWLCDNASKLKARDLSAMEHLVYHCADLHLHHIRSSGDPFELGEARPLDFGHWSAHQLESMTDYQIGHGQAVAIGIMLDALYAVRAGLIDSSVADRLFEGLASSGFSLWTDSLDDVDAGGKRILLTGLDRFREHLGGRLCITMPISVGAAKEISEVDLNLMELALIELKGRVAQS